MNIELERDTLNASLRNNKGTGASRELRRQNKIPAIIYGNKKDPISVALDYKETYTLYRKHMFTSKIININLDGKIIEVVAKDIAFHRVSDAIQHVDFVFLADKLQKVKVPLKFAGYRNSPGIKKGGFFHVAKRKIEILCPINNITPYLEIDASRMTVGTKIRVSDFPLDSGVSYVTNKNLVVASITGRTGKADSDEDKEDEEK